MNEEQLIATVEILSKLADSGVTAFVAYLLIDFLKDVLPHVLWISAGVTSVYLITRTISGLSNNARDIANEIDKRLGK